MKKVFTLAIIRRGDQVLLGMKKRKHGKGLWNGFGGKIEAEETIEEAAIRECYEECKIQVQKMVKRGELAFYYEDKPLGANIHEVHVFEVKDFFGEPQETDEMNPRWFSIDDIPYDQMWESDRDWLPLLLSEKHFRGTFAFTSDKQVVSRELREVSYS